MAKENGNYRWRTERRDCVHYYQEGGCLDLAAKEDLRAVPCRGCKLLEVPQPKMARAARGTEALH